MAFGMKFPNYISFSITWSMLLWHFTIHSSVEILDLSVSLSPFRRNRAQKGHLCLIFHAMQTDYVMRDGLALNWIIIKWPIANYSITKQYRRERSYMQNRRRNRNQNKNPVRRWALGLSFPFTNRVCVCVFGECFASNHC